jgi:alpha-beta hydrolase superfamily lysophospholipase
MVRHSGREKTKTVILLILVALLLLTARHALIPGKPQQATTGSSIWPEREKQSQQWFKTRNKLKGVGMAIHGLNLNPARMEPLIIDLNRMGIDVLNVSLSGHGANYSAAGAMPVPEQRLGSFRSVTYALWQDEVYRAYRSVRKRANQRKVPVFFVGYSLGGVLGCNLLGSRPDVSFDRMVLFAPALNVSIESYLLKAMAPFPNVVIDSLSPEHYRANDGTPLAAYKALFEAISHFEQQIGPRLNVPTLLFIDPKDEFISFAKLREVIAQNRLDQWTIHPVDKDDDVDQRTARHLIIDESSTGASMWGQIRSVISRHLLPGRRPATKPRTFLRT